MFDHDYEERLARVERLRRRYTEELLEQLKHDRLTTHLKKHRRLVTTTIAAYGLASKGGLKVAERLAEAERHMLDAAADGVGYVVRPSGLTKDVVGGAFNLAEDILVGTINAISPFPGKVESYGQYLRRMRSKNRSRSNYRTKRPTRRR